MCIVLAVEVLPLKHPLSQHCLHTIYSEEGVGSQMENVTVFSFSFSFREENFLFSFVTIVS